eukprot:CAMPEP_0113241466 /NCGR_PEP_ID=MMETSP0008_2-20120614/6812_1 /TAXON_ID=97485 /ORGANISM="Prymnesium parvum" /LENGTH=34 /DNA_ID=CAMNT_0000088877 /DNA_START=612 /DNA_END=713 /DNA_ORIENTATION=+ /assembly_acc=CAM_ASM_000153
MRRRTSRLLTRLAHALEMMRPIGAGGAATEEWGW